MANLTYQPSQLQDERQRRIESIRAVLASRSILGFTQFTFDGTFQIGAHLRILCKALDEWVHAEEPYNMIVSMPPRHGKTEICTRRLVPYIFGHYPDSEVMLASYGNDLVVDHSRDIRRIMRSETYGTVFPDTRVAKAHQQTDQTSRTNAFDIISRRGKFRSAGIGGPFSGRGADFGIIDDPIKGRKEAESPAVRETCLAWYKSVFRTRLSASGRILMPLTRWHRDDLAGWCLQQMQQSSEADRWRVVSMPAVAELDHDHLHPEDVRAEGQALFPERFPIEYLNKVRATIGKYDWNSLYQQRPDLPGGNKIKRHWIKVIPRGELPNEIVWVRFWDLAVTAKTSADYTAGVKMGMDDNGNVYVDRVERQQYEWPDAQNLIKGLAIEEQVPLGITTTGMQKGFFQAFQREPELRSIPIYGYREVKDKYTRAVPWIARAEGGKFFLVDGPWRDDYIDELTEFTGQGDSHDDQVDATSGAYQMFVGAVEEDMEVLGEYQLD